MPLTRKLPVVFAHMDMPQPAACRPDGFCKIILFHPHVIGVQHNLYIVRAYRLHISHAFLCRIDEIPFMTVQHLHIQLDSVLCRHLRKLLHVPDAAVQISRLVRYAGIICRPAGIQAASHLTDAKSFQHRKSILPEPECILHDRRIRRCNVFIRFRTISAREKNALLFGACFQPVRFLCTKILHPGAGNLQYIKTEFSNLSDVLQIVRSPLPFPVGIIDTILHVVHLLFGSFPHPVSFPRRQMVICLQKRRIALFKVQL